MRKLAHWCVRHRVIVIAVWIAALVAVGMAAGSAGTAYRDTFKLSGTQSFDAQRLLQESAPKAAGDSERVVFAVEDGTVRSAAAKQRITATLERLERFPGVVEVQSPFAPTGAAQISKDGSVAFADVRLAEESIAYEPPESKEFVEAARADAGDGLQVEVAGQVARQANQPNLNSTVIGVIAALIVLLLVFGSLLAAATPLLITGMALGVALGVTALLSHVISIATFSSELSLLIGLGVGVDYALFIVTRMRQGIQAGKPVEEAIVDALDTSGRAVLFAGITVCIALLGMFALGVSFLYGVAVAASIAVAFTVIAALTLLPAILSFIGPRVLSRRQRRALGAAPLAETGGTGFWTRWAAIVSRRPNLVGATATLLVLIIAIPFLSMRLGSADSGSDPVNTTTRKAYDLLAQGFGPGSNGTLQLVAKVDGASDRASFEQARNAAAGAEGVVSVTPTTVLPAKDGNGGVALAQIVPEGSPQAESTTELVELLRSETVPKATAGSGVTVLVGGETAIFEDFSTVLSEKLPFFMAVVVGLSFLLLMAVFRSLLIPLTAAAMNLLSAAAAYGVITAVFQKGWGDFLLGVDKTGPIEPFIPVMMFAIVFGLSMDYQVFLVSRMYEEWHRTGDNREAISRGLAATGRTITAAAAIMILVFGAFVLGGDRIIKLFGLGLASAVAIDALIVRSALVPAIMTLLGDRNWWLPSWLDRVIPRLNVEGDVEHGDEPRPAAAVSGAPAPEAAGP